MRPLETPAARTVRRGRGPVGSVSGVLGLFVVRVSAMIASLVTVAVLARIQGLGAVGVWGLAMSAVALVGAVGDIGLGTIAQRTIASGDGHGYWIVRRVVKTWLAGLVMALLAAGAVWGLTTTQSTDPWSQLGAIGVPVALLVSARAVEKVLSDLARARSRQFSAAMFGWQGATVATGVGSLVAILAGWQPDLGDFVLWHAAWAGVGVVALGVVEHRASVTASGHEQGTDLDGIQVLREGALISGAHLTNFLQQGADVWVLGILVGSSEGVGVYYLASRMASMVSLPLAATLQWSQPHLARSLEDAGSSDRRAITMATRFAAVGAAALGVVVTLASGTAYGFVASGPVPDLFSILIGVLAAGYVVDAATGPVGYGLMLRRDATFLIAVNGALGSAAVLAMFALALTPMNSVLAVAVVVGFTVATRALIAERRFARIAEYSPLLSLISPRRS